MEFTNEELTNKVLDFDTKFDSLYAKVLTIENDVQHLTARVDTMQEELAQKAIIADVDWKYEKIKNLIRELAKIIKQEIEGEKS